MKQSEIYEKHTDFISDRQEVLLWLFDSSVLQSVYKTYSYAIPVEREFFNALKEISESKSKQVRDRRFTVFVGDCGPGFGYFAIAVSAKINSKVTDIITGYLEGVTGYETMEYGRIPYVPLIPRYRYDMGNVYEYTSEIREAGKFRKGDDDTAGVKVQYRLYRSAEEYEMKERYVSDSHPGREYDVKDPLEGRLL